ncbi:MAG: sulfurtransferase TusA family protein [Nitrosopumilaceae archaeon]
MQKEPPVIINKSSTELLRISVAKSVDTRGMACPYPSFEAVRAMNSLNTNDVLEVVTDSDESALESIPSVCEKRMWEFLVVEEDKDLWRVRIKK